MRYFHSQKYFWKILTTVGIVSVVAQFIMLSILAYFMVVPLGKRATEDLASVIVHAAETWHSLPDNQRPAFIERMKVKHELLMTIDDKELEETHSLLPYLYFLEQSLNNQVKTKIQIKQNLTADDIEWYWVDIPVSDSVIRFGFPRSRIGVNPSFAFMLLLTIGFILTLITAVVMTKRLTVPIERLHQAAKSIRKNQWPEPVEIEGPEELSVLAHEFNRMSVQVRELLSNRTTLLTGIAHDLRTPLTQIQLAFTMLQEDRDNSELMESIQEDLDMINRLINETLSLGLELEGANKIETDIVQELREVAKKFSPCEIDIHVSGVQTCCQVIDSLALRRILNNLLENAVRYGQNKPITINYKGDENNIVIQIIDQGPGIPVDQTEAVFRPFYRLEKSRGSKTGGSGLGLAIVRQLADANHWKVQLLASSEGGLKAEITIPIY